MSEVVGYVQYDAEDLVECIRRRSEQALQKKQITLQNLSDCCKPTSSRYTCLLNRCQVSGSGFQSYILTPLTPDPHPNFPVIPTILLSLAVIVVMVAAGIGNVIQAAAWTSIMAPV